MTAALRNQIRDTLASIGVSAPALLSHARAEKLYEVFALSCVVRALVRIGATLEARDGDDRRVTSLGFRLGPGRIYGSASGAGFLNVTYGGSEYELHTELQVLGTSKVPHELDVCILEKNAARQCRRNRIDPTMAAVRLLAECKYYGRTLPLRIGREYLGLGTEFSIRVKALVASADNDQIHRMVKRHRGMTAFETTPVRTRKVTDLVGWLAKELEHALRRPAPASSRSPCRSAKSRRRVCGTKTFTMPTSHIFTFGGRGAHWRLHARLCFPRSSLTRMIRTARRNFATQFRDCLKKNYPAASGFTRTAENG